MVEQTARALEDPGPMNRKRGARTMNRKRVRTCWTGAAIEVAAMMVVAAAGFCLSANAQQLSKSGSIAFHTGWKYSADVVTPSDKHVLGRGNATGVTFNDKGTGP